jgi:hypothetical protein
MSATTTTVPFDPAAARALRTAVRRLGQGWALTGHARDRIRIGHTGGLVVHITTKFARQGEPTVLTLEPGLGDSTDAPEDITLPGKHSAAVDLLVPRLSGLRDLCDEWKRVARDGR